PPRASDGPSRAARRALRRDAARSAPAAFGRRRRWKGWQLGRLPRPRESLHPGLSIASAALSGDSSPAESRRCPGFWPHEGQKSGRLVGEAAELVAEAVVEGRAV